MVGGCGEGVERERGIRVWRRKTKGRSEWAKIMRWAFAPHVFMMSGMMVIR
jgi:hypothetical protein